MSKKLIVSAMIAAFTVTGCANMSGTQKGAAIGAGVGAVAGAIAGKGKGAVIGTAVGAGIGAIAGNAWSKKMEAQKKEMEAATQGTGVEVTKTEDNQLKLEVPSDLSFAVGSASLDANFKQILDTFATGLVQNPSAALTIIGHTDSTGSDAVNNPLSLKRANSVRNYLVTKGVAASRFMTEGHGSHEPLVANDTAANKAKNRRVEIFVAEPAPVAEAAPQG